MMLSSLGLKGFFFVRLKCYSCFLLFLLFLDDEVEVNPKHSIAK